MIDVFSILLYTVLVIISQHFFEVAFRYCHTIIVAS